MQILLTKPDMKKVLYISNIEVPYRVRFFNELGKYCDLTVLYERRQSSSRNAQWAASEKKQFQTEYLDGMKLFRESTFSLRILKYVLGSYDYVVIGCYNSPVQTMAIAVMKLLRRSYFLNADGEVFLGEGGIKNSLKRFALRGAAGYLAAGEKSAQSLKKISGSAPVISYYFSSLSEEEVRAYGVATAGIEREEFVLVVGQYLEVKGLDVALRAAEMDPYRHYKFVGMGSRTEQFMKDFHPQKLPNVTVIPFLPKKELEIEYQRCGVFVLPSRQECWGLVVNEAAAFGTPIVSTWGSGAAVEYLSDRYPQYLAKTADSEDLLRCLNELNNAEDTAEYSAFLMEKSRKYTIERSVRAHLDAFGIE